MSFDVIISQLLDLKQWSPNLVMQHSTRRASQNMKLTHVSYQEMAIWEPSGLCLQGLLLERLATAPSVGPTGLFSGEHRLRMVSRWQLEEPSSRGSQDASIAWNGP